MARRYIDKDTLVAQIERYIKQYKGIISSVEGRQLIQSNVKGRITGYVDILSFIDTLEVKEVDLEKEIDDYINEHFSECGDGVLISDANSTELTLLDVMPMARHFYELGLAQKGE